MGGQASPLVLYGTAFKGQETRKLTELALAKGFSGVDSANFPVSYNEAQTGDAVAAAIKSGIGRDALFIQTKFTPAWAFGTHTVPFDPRQSIENQIRASIQQSLCHLKTGYIDSFLLHAPFQNEQDTFSAWDVLETFVPHTIRTLGVSNFVLPQLRALYEHAAQVKPTTVQNSFTRARGFDIELRAFCTEHNITYQPFHVLRHNPEAMASCVVAAAAAKLGVERELAFYVLILGLGGTQILDGTTEVERMVQDTTTISQVFDQDNPSLLNALQPDIEDFRKLLLELAG